MGAHQVEQCSQLGLQCGQVCDALEGFTVTDIDTNGTCIEGGVNALKEVGTCVFDSINFSCNSVGKVIGSGGGVSVQTNVYNWEGTKFYCQNNPNDLSGSFPVEVDLIFE